MPHKPVKFSQLSEEKSHEQSLNLPSLLFCRLVKGIQTVNIIKSDSSVYCMLDCSSGPERHRQRN